MQRPVSISIAFLFLLMTYVVCPGRTLSGYHLHLFAYFCLYSLQGLSHSLVQLSFVFMLFLSLVPGHLSLLLRCPLYRSVPVSI